MKHKVDPSCIRRDVRNVYESPTLREFGLVGVLTQSGTGTVGEQATGGGMCSNDSRPMC